MERKDKWVYVPDATIWAKHKDNILNPSGKYYTALVLRADTGEIYNRGGLYGGSTAIVLTVDERSTGDVVNSNKPLPSSYNNEPVYVKFKSGIAQASVAFTGSYTISAVMSLYNEKSVKQVHIHMPGNLLTNAEVTVTDITAEINKKANKDDVYDKVYIDGLIEDIKSTSTSRPVEGDGTVPPAPLVADADFVKYTEKEEHAEGSVGQHISMLKGGVAELSGKAGFIETATGKYAEVGEKSMSVAVNGKAIGTDGKEFSKTGYAISSRIQVNRGDILIFPSSQILPIDVSFFNRAVTRTYNKIDHYDYEYDDDGNVTKETPVFVEVTESFYEALSAQSVAAMPATGYVYLCPTTMEIVVCGLQADIASKKLGVYGLGIFKNMATNFVGAPGQRIIAQAFLQMEARIKALESMIENLGSVRCRALTVDDIPAVCGVPIVLLAHGVPADGNVPINWDTATLGEWNGCPAYMGSVYINVDASGNGVYYATGTDAVNNWKQA